MMCGCVLVKPINNWRLNIKGSSYENSGFIRTEEEEAEVKTRAKTIGTIEREIKPYEKEKKTKTNPFTHLWVEYWVKWKGRRVYPLNEETER